MTSGRDAAINRSQADLMAEIDRLQEEVQYLAQRNRDLEIALLTTAEHGDFIEAQLHESNQKLAAEVAERQLAQATLQEILETVSRDKHDLELILQTTAEHGDLLEYQLYTQAVEAMRQNLEQQLAERAAAMQAAEAKYRSIFENAAEGIFQILPDGRYLDANPAVAEIFGYSTVAELLSSVTHIGQQLYVQPSRWDELLAYLRGFDCVSGFESEVYRKDGSTIWISEDIRMVRDEAGNILRYEGSVRDITERKATDAELRQQRLQSERLLLNILPQPIAERLKRGETVIADKFPDATVIFADLVNFTELSSYISPTELVELLNHIFSTFDRLADRHEVEKIKTIGDAYMAVSGISQPRPDHVSQVIEMALEMLQESSHFSTPAGQPIPLRIGIHAGPVVAGIIGTRKFIYDLWGDTVNIASRMESQGEAGRIQVTEAVYDRLRRRYQFEERGEIDVKGKGLMKTYWLLGKRDAL